MDELCVRFSPSLWLWVAVSRRVGQVLGFAFGQRDRGTLALCWSDVPADYQAKPVVTDGYGAYTSFFAPDQHRPIDKGAGEIGETSLVESLNTKWRQRQSGLVRRSCGVSRRIEAGSRRTWWSVSFCWWSSITLLAKGSGSANTKQCSQINSPTEYLRYEPDH
jgi:IS1 family transposase